MKLLIAPDKFKHALSADEACAAMAEGVRRSLADAELDRCPLGDGGEGTGAIIAAALGAEERTATVTDPLGRRREARWWFQPQRRHAIVEMAEASGLWLLKDEERSARRATSYGTGELLRVAAEAGATRITLCVGGSATVDGGAGCLQALGWTLRDSDGGAIAAPAGGETLARIRQLEPPAGPFPAAIEILCDVDNPLLGDRGAAPIFARQKGASDSDMEFLASALAKWAEVLRAQTGRNVAQLPGGGAAGGLPASLHAAYDATLRPGIDVVAELVDLDCRLRTCDICLTGEGALDEQTSGGKTIAGLARRAGEQGKPVVAFVGALKSKEREEAPNIARSLGLQAIEVITPPDTPLPEALKQTRANLTEAVARYLRKNRP